MRRRQGFTLVELLVSVALIVFIMVILSEAFSASMTAFRLLKGVGDMDARLRTASNLLRNDLTADHFEGKKRLSDPNFWAEGPPREGFFRLFHGSLLKQTAGSAYFQECDDGSGDSLPVNRAADHVLHFTAKRRGNNRGDFFTGQVPATSPLLGVSTNFFNQPIDARYQDVAGTYVSQWAEIAYFLQANGASAAGATPLFSLYRRQRLVLPNTLDANTNDPVKMTPIPAAAATMYNDLSLLTAGGNLAFNNPSDLAVPDRRLSSYMPVTDSSGNPTNGDLILTDVLSFEVRVIVLTSAGGPSTPSALHSLPAGSFVDGNNPSFGAAKVFDTWTDQASTSPIANIDYSSWATAGTTISLPLKAQVLALAVTIRVYDFKTEQTRQITIIQDM